jgi:hypothetical protein
VQAPECIAKILTGQPPTPDLAMNERVNARQLDLKMFQAEIGRGRCLHWVTHSHRFSPTTQIDQVLAVLFKPSSLGDAHRYGCRLLPG